MDVIIVSKTRMSTSACVGGVLANGKFVRLLNKNQYNQNLDTNLNVGDVYTIQFTERQNRRTPHIEDILVHNWKYKFSFNTISNMVTYLRKKLNPSILIWNGNSNIIFDNCIQWTVSGSGYISETGNIPKNSVGFWIPNHDLRRNDYNTKVRYQIEGTNRKITFVGFQKPVQLISAGTLLRISLARWWAPNDDDVEERCYLQLSGWYEKTESIEEEEFIAF
jgi:hypothetical protein